MFQIDYKIETLLYQQYWWRSKSSTRQDNRSGSGESLGKWWTQRVGVRATTVVLHRRPFITTPSRHWSTSLSTSCSRCSQNVSRTMETDFAQVRWRLEALESCCRVDHYWCGTVTVVGTSKICFVEDLPIGAPRTPTICLSCIHGCCYCAPEPTLNS